MGIFSDILLCADFDKTLTAPDSTIPERNLEAIQYFMDNGGAFTVNTGRSRSLSRMFLDRVPVNAPVLMYNGAAAYDTVTGAYPILHSIPLDQETVLRQVMDMCPDFVTEVHGLDSHYTFRKNPGWENLYDSIGGTWAYAEPDSDMGPFIKMSICGPFSSGSLRALFQSDPEYVRQYDVLEEALRREFSQTLSIMRAAPQIIDLQTVTVNKGTAARELAQMLNRKILVCVGDERNDLAMMDMADYAFCPGDAKIAAGYENVCPCAEGAVADVIYKKIPAILGLQP